MPVAIDKYRKYMHTQKNTCPVQCTNSPILGCSPDGKVIDPNCEDPFGLLEVKCPETKFQVSPLDNLRSRIFFLKERRKKKTPDTFIRPATNRPLI